MKSSVLVLAVLVSACGITKGGSPTAPGLIEPVAPSSVQPRALALLLGKVWTGLQIPACPTCGEGGPISMTFAVSPATGVVDVALRYLSQNGNVYHGTAKGILNGVIAVTIDPQENPSGTLCGYEAYANMPQENRIEGDFIGIGSGPNCGKKRGTFWMQADVLPEVVCMQSVTSASVKAGDAMFTVTAAPVTLSLVGYRVVDPPNFYPQEWVRQHVRTFIEPGSYAMHIDPAYPNRQEDLYCGAYPEGLDLTPDVLTAWQPFFLAADSGTLATTMLRMR